ncbi:hypothetical protein GH5_03347 [Leishmania sp. Ghana 2012 LV757]|uniref:hypothetical protein n=1 Tax=Leishmania sp. Ghana 2012 LV757 TaxID=2803181 RepID=UPI001B7CBE1C|nr:hypothetical protein GH5_03347 [Leishmania sp. Ghana 2012 LV757]
MTSLPVLHLKATSKQNVTAAADLCDTTVTLYTFLRSIPSAAETERALQPFLDSLHSTPSSCRASLMRRPNHRLVQRLESVAIDGVFRDTPNVLPALARHSDRWLRRLGYASVDDGIADSMAAMDAAGHAASGSPHLTSSAKAATQPLVHMRATDMHQYVDPYSAYEANYAQRHSAARSSPAGALAFDEANSSKNGSSEEASGLQRRGAAQLREEVSSVSAEVSALTVPGSESRLSEARQSMLHGLSRAPTAAISSAPGIHPVLHLIAEQALQQQQEEEGVVEGRGMEGEKNQRGAPLSSSDAAVEEKLHQLAARLNEAEAQLTGVMSEKEAAEQVWSPYYSRLKTSMMYVEELKSRVQNAASLYLLLRYERETLQQAHLGVAMESMSLQLVLRDVQARLQDEQTRSLADGHQQSTEDHKLLQRLSAALAASPAASRRSAA